MQNESVEQVVESTRSRPARQKVDGLRLGKRCTRHRHVSSVIHRQRHWVVSRVLRWEQQQSKNEDRKVKKLMLLDWSRVQIARALSSSESMKSLEADESRRQTWWTNERWCLRYDGGEGPGRES
ncbi:hypothetical protein E4U21_006802 [Claviceps maximensis]|nr:hypothetical protein E4U21_006802 [Claviceps maximensis]